MVAVRSNEIENFTGKMTVKCKKSLEKRQRNAKSRWKKSSEMQKVVGKIAAKRIKVVGKMTATIAKVA